MPSTTSNITELLNNIPSELLTALVTAIIAVPLTLFTERRNQKNKILLNNDSVTLNKLLTHYPGSFMYQYFTQQDFGLLIDGDGTAKICDSVPLMNTVEYTFLNKKIEKYRLEFVKQLKLFDTLITEHFGYEEERNVFHMTYPHIIGQEKYNRLCKLVNTQADLVYQTYTTLITKAKSTTSFSSKEL